MGAQPAEKDVCIERIAAVPMRDGCVLQASIYRPDRGGPYPVLVLRTPYGRDTAAITHLAINPVRAAAAGFIVVIQDVRGRFGSGGDFEPYVHEFTDGFDTIQWAAALPDASGAVGAYGVSYMGTVAWQAATAAPPALRAIATAQATNDAFKDLSWRGGAFNWGMHLFWVLGTFGVPHLVRGGEIDAAQLERAIAALDDYEGTASHLPPAGLPAANPERPFLPFFNEAMAESTRSDYHDERSVAGRYGGVEVPAMIVGGWHDVMLSNDLRHFAGVRAEGGTAAAREGTRLVVGPWSHGSGMASAVTGDCNFGMRASGNSLDLGGDLTQHFLEWFGPRLRGEPVPESAPVKLFVMGADRWRDEEEWPPSRARTERWYLRGGGGLSRQAPTAATTPTSYVYDPSDPCPTTGGGLLMPETYRRGPVDQAPILGRGDVLSFTSAPLEQDVEVVGPVGAVLFAATSAVDTDWVVKLCQVTSAGRTINICDGVIRARFRDGDLTTPRLVEPDAILRYEVDLWATAIVIPSGQRLRVLISSSDFPRYDRNPNTGELGVLAVRAEPARQRVFHDPEHASHVTLPELP